MTLFQEDVRHCLCVLCSDADAEDAMLAFVQLCQACCISMLLVHLMGTVTDW
jgi:hypothetical protein